MRTYAYKLSTILMALKVLFWIDRSCCHNSAKSGPSTKSSQLFVMLRNRFLLLSQIWHCRKHWGFTDLEERTTWANTMAKHVRTLCRHASQQHRRKPRPRWLPDLAIPEQSSRGAPSAQSSSTRPTRSSAGYIKEAKEIDFDNGDYLSGEQQMHQKDTRSLILNHAFLYCIIVY